MIKAQIADKERIIEILVYSFEQNQSVNFIVKQDEIRLIRLRKLMDYAYKTCAAFGKVLLSDDGNACALVLYKKKAFSLRSILWNLQLVFGVLGVSGVVKVLKRESLIKSRHPSHPFYYLWFIGVHPVHKGLGIGTSLLNELIADANTMNLPIYLETSTIRNIPWYQKFGFRVFDEIDIGYKLSFLKRTIDLP